MVKSNLSHLCLGEASQRKYRAAEILLRQHPEEISLVLMGVHRCLEIHVSAVLGNLRIMPCGDIVTAVLLRRLHEFAPLNVRIAHDTRVRRATTSILAHEITNHMLTESVAEVQYMVLEAQRSSHTLRIENTLLGSAVKPTPIASQGGVGIGYGRLGIGNWGRVEGAESGTHEFVTLLQE